MRSLQVPPSSTSMDPEGTTSCATCLYRIYSLLYGLCGLWRLFISLPMSNLIVPVGRLILWYVHAQVRSSSAVVNPQPNDHY
jgi:hypothetical protein